VKPITIESLSTLEAEFQKMDKYYSATKQNGLMLAQIRRVKVKGKYIDEFHIAGQFVEHDMSAKILEIMKAVPEI
jgi:hypothetical protein